MKLFVETQKMLLGGGAAAEIRPLTYREREHARAVARDAALELAGRIDPSIIGTYGQNQEAADAVAASGDVRITGDLDTMTVVEAGLVAVIDAEGNRYETQDTDLIDKLTNQITEMIAKEIFRISTLEDTENLSGESQLG